MRNRTSRRGILAALGALTGAVSLFALMGAGAAGAAGAATIGPDSFGYTATSTSESLRTLSGGALTLSVGDDQVQSVPIGFPFSFYGTSYNDTYVSSNGFLSFDPGVSQGCCSGNTLPQPDAVNNAISAFWTDVCPGTGYSTSYCYGTIRTETIGTTPNREFVADYDIDSYYCSISGPRLKFQIILHETTNVIQLQYGQLDLDPYSRSQAAGIEDAAGTTGLQIGLGKLTGLLSHGGWIISSGPTDTDAPIATPTQSPAANGAGWNNTDVTVSWNWADEVDGSGIDAGNCTTSSVSAGEGTIMLAATCADIAGNVGNVGKATTTVMVDKTDPTVAFSGNAGSYTVDQTVTIGGSATDALSGIASSTCPTVSAAASSLSLGSHSLTATATDVAGNTTTTTTSFTVTVDGTSLCALAQQLSSKPGIASSLCVKIAQIVKAQAKGQTKVAANVLGALDNELRAQTGKALTAAEAALISSLAAQL